MSAEITAEGALAMTYTEELSVEKVISAPIEVAYTQFREVVWKKNAFVTPESWTKIVEEGDANHVGEVRMAGGLMKEKILATKENEEIMYTVLGPLPVENHLGIVKFTPEADGKTKIVWIVKYTPKFGANLIVKGIIKSFFPLFLNQLEKHVSKPSE